MLKFQFMFGSKKRFVELSLLFTLLLLTLFSCEEKNTNTVLYTKPIDENYDATCKWLNEKSNYHKSDYLVVFYNYFDKKIKEKDYLNAAKAMEIVSKKKVHYYTYDDVFIAKLREFSKKYGDKVPEKNTTFVNSYFGDYYSDNGDFKKSIVYYNKITKLQPDDYYSCANIANAYYDVSFSHFSLGDQDLAMKNTMMALKYFSQIDDNTGKGSVYTNLSSISVATKNYKQGEEYGRKAMEFYRKAKDTTNIIISLYNKIHNYEEAENPKMYPLIDSTYNYFNKIKYINPSLKIAIYTYYTKKLLHENRLEDTKKVLDSLKQDVVELNSITSTQEFEVALAEYEVKKNKGILNIDIIKSAIPTLLENENYQIALSYYDLLKEDAIMKKDYKNALVYENELRKASDSLASNQMRNKVLELNKQYETANKEREIELQKNTILNKNTTIALLASLLIGIFLTITIIYYRQNQKKLKSEKIRGQQYTKQLLEKTEEERKRIASDLHDSVSHELLSLKNSLDEKTESINKKIDTIINDIRSISRNLHPVMFDKIGLKVSVEQLVERAQSLNDFMVTADIDYHSTLSSTDELQLYRILQEALSNIIKYANAVAAKITIWENSSFIHIEIKDNGKGFNVSETLAKKDAFGLHNIIERSRAIGGEAKITSDKSGTIIKIEIKKV